MYTLSKDDILRISLFSGVAHDELLSVLQDCKVKDYSPGQYIYRYGEYGDDCCIVLSGSVNIELIQGGLEDTKKGLLLKKDGDIIGEIAALSGYIRTADVVALQPTKIIIIPRETLFKLLDRFQPIKNKIDSLYRQRALSALLLTIPIFQGVPGELFGGLLDKITLQSYSKGEVVFHQGDDADAIYLVRYGFIKVAEIESSGRERVLAYLKGGQYFGEMALLDEGGERMATVTAINRSELIRISREDFLNIIESHPRLKESLGKTIKRREERNIRIREDENISNTLTAVVDSGVIQAKGILIIDLTKCIHCDNCVNACAALHTNQSRLMRKGVRLNNVLLVATSCRHCDDPTCMIECSTGAISRDFAGEIYIRDFCIGCGKCARKCPYGNISIVILSETDYDKGFFKTWLRKKGDEKCKKNTEMPAPNNKIKGRRRPGRKAVKCDMCREYPFIGCVYNCPTGAVRRVDPTDFFADITTIS